MKILFMLLTALLILIPQPVLASHCTDPNTNQPSPTISHQNSTTLPCPITSLSGAYDTLQKVFNVVFGAMLLVAAFMLLYAAFIYLTAEGSREALTKARHMIIYIVIALIVAAFAWGLPKVIISIL